MPSTLLIVGGCSHNWREYSQRVIRPTDMAYHKIKSRGKDLQIIKWREKRRKKDKRMNERNRENEERTKAKKKKKEE